MPSRKVSPDQTNQGAIRDFRVGTKGMLSAAAAVQNLCLEASAHEDGSIWRSLCAGPPVRGILGIEEGASVVALLALGYPETVPPALPWDDSRTHMKQVP